MPDSNKPGLTSTQKNLITLAIGTVILIVGYFVFLQTATTPISTNNSPGSSSSTPNKNVPKIVDAVLEIKEGKLVRGDAVIKAKEGDSIIFHVTSDKDDEFHLHGYDKSINLRAGITSDLMVTASTTGRFPIELHVSELEIGALEVEPR